jgi:hypothetical protein
MNKLSTIKGPLLVFLSAIMFGSYGTWSRLIGTSHGVFYPGWTRALLISIILLRFCYIQNKLSLSKERIGNGCLFFRFYNIDPGSIVLCFQSHGCWNGYIIIFRNNVINYVYSWIFLFTRKINKS